MAVKGGRLGIETVRMFNAQFNALHCKLKVEEKFVRNNGELLWEPAVVLHAVADMLSGPFKAPMMELSQRFLNTKHLAVELDFPVLPPEAVSEDQGG